MAERSVRDCDMCEKKEIDPVSVTLSIASRMDSSGHGRERDVENFDLCTKCASVVITRIVDRWLDYSENRRIVSMIKNYEGRTPNDRARI